MNCCQCQGIEKTFNEKYVARELSGYRRKGPDKTTRMLIEALERMGVRGLTLLDIGGGVGAIQHGLLEAGVDTAMGVDASAAYLDAAQSEAIRRGYADRISQQHGNFVDLASHLKPAGVVTLDRVICCYDDMEKLVGLSTALAEKFYGVVYPRDTWWVKIALAIQNFFLRLIRNPFQTYAHPSQNVEAIVMGKGFKQQFYRKTLVWQVVVYSR